MLDLISFEMGGIPIVFWAAMTAIMLAMYFMAKAKLNEVADQEKEELYQVPAQQKP